MGAVRDYLNQPVTLKQQGDPAKTIKGASIAVLAGAALVLVGTLMTWVTFTGGLLIIDRSGVSYDTDAKLMIGFAVIAALGAVGELADVEVLPGYVRSSAAVFGAIVIVMGIYALSQINDRIHAAQTAGANGAVGTGVYVAIAGGVLLLVSGLRLVDAQRRARRQEPS